MSCKRCGKELPEKPIGKGRPRVYCQQCVIERRSEYFRNWYESKGNTRNRYGNYQRTEAQREAIRQWNRNNPEKRYAHSQVALALRRGDMKNPGRCSRCGKYTHYLDAHHEDYSKPLDVEWLCLSCHRQKHLAKKNEKEKIMNNSDNAAVRENGRKGGRPRKVDPNDEEALFLALRNAYSNNFSNGKSDECFLLWVEGKLTV